MYITLAKHHVLRCPKCGQVRVGSFRERASCMSCRHSWKLLQKGQAVGVLGSYWSPADATRHAMVAKEKCASLG